VKPAFQPRPSVFRINVISERIGHATSSFIADAQQHVTPALELLHPSGVTRCEVKAIQRSINPICQYVFREP
jgi:hypothetical protein